MISQTMLATADPNYLSQPIFGPIRLLAAPTGNVVKRSEVKSQARIVSLKDDGLIDNSILVGTEFCENSIAGHRQFLTASYALPLKRWWWGQLKLPRPPLQRVDGIYYYDAAGTRITVDPSVYIVETPWRSQGTVELAPNQGWPSVQWDRTHPIEIHFTCGYGTAADVPPGIKYAISVAAAQAYYGRRQVNDSTAESIENYLDDTFGYGSYS